MNRLNQAPRAAWLLLAIAAATLLGPLAFGERATRPLDPAVAAHRPPGTKLWELHLADGRILAAEEFDPTPPARMNRLGKPETIELAPGPHASTERRFLLGSDRFGREVLATTLRAGRVSLVLAVASGLAALLFGVAWGALSALGPPWLDTILSRVNEGMLAFPPLLGALLLAILLPGSFVALVLVLASVAWMGSARLVRGELLWMRGQDWALAAIAGGASRYRLFVRHLLPNLVGLVAVDAAHRVAALLLAEAAMSFLGFGVQPPATSWGLLLSESRGELGHAWWTAIPPGLAILSTTFALSSLGDAIRDRFDPHRSIGPRDAPAELRPGRTVSTLLGR